MKITSKKGFALIVVLSFVVMVVAVLIAFMTSVMTERSASSGYAASVSARRLADNAVALVEAQINTATTQGTNVAWTSQPGMVRTFDTAGNLKNAYKLYSAANMIDINVAMSGTEYGLGVWQTSPALWVDLNAPVMVGSGTNYPILDPKAFVDLPSGVPSGSIVGLAGTSPKSKDPITGAYIYGGLSVVANGPRGQTAVPLAGGSPVPMPVRWLYVLSDGSIVAPDSTSSGTAANIPAASGTIQVVGRIAFWTDDETCKVNINTASAGITTGTLTAGCYVTDVISAGSYWDIPRTFTQTEVEGFALNQPARGEYQRYPGHPATVSLAAILPEMLVTGTAIDPNAFQYAEKLYGITPRVMGEKDNPNFTQPGGPWTSYGGTQIPGSSDPANPLTGIISDGDRLFTSLDELMFTSGSTVVTGGTTFRAENGIISKEVLDSRRFLLTAQSRAPETNLFNLPRVACWPIYALTSGTIDSNRTNAYDRMIALCASTGTFNTANVHPYFFQRQNALDPDNDWVNIQRNQDIYAYLQYLTGNGIPGFGLRDFKTKYGDDRNCILTEIFDYIRCLNLCDDTLDTPTVSGSYQFTVGLPGQTRQKANEVGKAGVAISAGGWVGDPGIGFVAPIHIKPSDPGAKDTLGQGRFQTLRQLSFVFIACAVGDGDTPTSSPKDFYHDYRYHYDRTATALNGTSAPATTDYPAPAFAMIDGTGAALAAKVTVTTSTTTYLDGTQLVNVATSGSGYKPYSNDPASNALLAQSGGKLNKGDVLVQVAVVPEFFCTMNGWKQYAPSMRVEIAGLEGFQLGGKPLHFPPCTGTDSGWLNVSTPGQDVWTDTRGGVIFPSQAYLYRQTSRHLPEGHYPYKSGYGYWSTTGSTWIARSGTGTDPGGNGIPAGHCDAGFQVYPWLSEPVRVSGGYTPGTSGNTFNNITFTAGPITVRTRAGTLATSGTVQELTMTVPSGQIKCPRLSLADQLNPVQVGTTGTYTGPNCVNYWTFFNDSDGIGAKSLSDSGAAAIPTTTGTDGSTTVGSQVTTTSGTNWEGGTFGRFSPQNNTRSPWVMLKVANASGTSTAAEYGDTILAMIPDWTNNVLQDYRVIQSRYQSDKSHYQSKEDFVPAFGWANGSGTSTAIMFWYGYAGADPRQQVMSGLAGLGWYNGQLYSLVKTPPGDLYGDFDIGMGGAQHGAFVNKSDEGDFTRAATTKDVHWTDGKTFPYFISQAVSTAAGKTYFSPNRIMPSPVNFGSLPTGVASGTGWQTLLFRPDWNGPAAVKPHPGTVAPKDHLLLDLFWMPVVEPYAISDRFSTAGKININYQILPFTYIDRSAAIRAVLLPEKMQLISNTTTNIVLHPKIDSTGDAEMKTHQSGLGYAPDNHFPLNLETTLSQFSGPTGRFALANGNKNVFISASEVCEQFMVPLVPPPASTPDIPGMPAFLKGNGTAANPGFFQTGDNVRERIYATIYPKLTTKSNTFTVHFRAQSLKKSPNSKAGTWTEGIDQVTGEYRGSTLIERFIDPNNPKIPDYAYDIAHGTYNDPSLDTFYKWRVISNTQFAP